MPGVSLLTCRYQYDQPASSVISAMFPDVPLASVRRKVTRPSVVAINGINFAPMTSLPWCARVQPSRHAPKSSEYVTLPITGKVIRR